MTESSNNKNYTAADIERYHSGKMSAMEMHALEKAAMEDPFLADALEGYAMTSTPQQDVEHIREKLFGQKKEEQTVSFIRKNIYWLRAAAVIIFIAGGAWLAFQMTGSKKSNIAVQTKKNESSPARDTAQGFDVATTPMRQMSDSLDSANIATAYNKGLVSTAVAKKPSSDFGRFLQDSVSSNVSGAIETYSFSLTPSAPATMITDSSLSYKSSILLPDSLTKYRVNTDVAVLDKGVSFNATSNANFGAVSGTTKTPLPTYNNNAYYSTRKDYFSSEKLMKKENAAAAGDTIKDLEIVLQPDNKGVEEIVVSADKKPVAERRKMELKVDTLEPEQGWKNFDDYIARNIQVPEELKSKQSISGEVQLSFDVNSNGDPVNIKVTKSLCDKCDEEAIRLLKEGPKWKKKKSKKGKVTIVF